MGEISRHLTVTNDYAEDLSAALAWALNTVDSDLAGANMVKINVAQIMRSTVPDDWHYVWIASVSGCFDKDGPQ